MVYFLSRCTTFFVNIKWAENWSHKDTWACHQASHVQLKILNNISPFLLKEFTEALQVQLEVSASAAISKACAMASPVQLDTYAKASPVQPMGNTEAEASPVQLSGYAKASPIELEG